MRQEEKNKFTCVQVYPVECRAFDQSPQFGLNELQIIRLVWIPSEY